MTTEPSYLALYRSGELGQRAAALEARLHSCNICPRECGVDRLAGERGYCHSGYLPAVASYCAHHGEEPVLSGRRGSGTIFLGNCNLRCVYCQNYQISQDPAAQLGNEVPVVELAKMMLHLQEIGCHNINLVSPTHFVPQLVRALLEAVPAGLRIPLVYNTNAYDHPETLHALDGIISIYLPDIKYASNRWGREFSDVPEYVPRARAAIKEMYRQVGNLMLDGDGIARRGLIVRHLILPGGLAGSKSSLGWLAHKVSPQVTVSILAQYHPAHKAEKIPALSRRITRREYYEVVRLVEELGLASGWFQGKNAPENYLPDFGNREDPFAEE